MNCVTVPLTLRRYARAFPDDWRNERMEIDAISGAATVALTSTIIFLFIAKTWNLIQQPYRDDADRLRRR